MIKSSITFTCKLCQWLNFIYTSQANLWNWHSEGIFILFVFVFVFYSTANELIKDKTPNISSIIFFSWSHNFHLLKNKCFETYLCNYCHVNKLKWTLIHHHHVVPPARISLTLSRHFSLSFIASGRSSGLHLVSSQSCCMYFRAGRPAFAQPYDGVHKKTSLMSSSLLL